MRYPNRPLAALLVVGVLWPVVIFAQPQSGETTQVSESTSEQEPKPFLMHVKTALNVDDAQICAVPNVAWAALAQGKRVTLLFDGSAVTSVASGFGWRGWLGIKTTAMDRAALPERERQSLAEQFAIPLETVPQDYGAYLHFLKAKGASIYYNRTMALLYRIDPSKIDSSLSPLGLEQMVELVSSPAVYLAY